MHFTATLELDDHAKTEVTISAPDDYMAQRALDLYVRGLGGRDRDGRPKVLDLKPTYAAVRVQGTSVYVAGLHASGGLEHLGEVT